MLHAEQIDPRDQRFEVDAPVYRVFFWSSADESRADLMWISDEWQLSGADIGEVLAWVQVHRGGRRASLWVVTRSGADVTHIRLAGTDPTTSDEDEIWPSWANSPWPRPSLDGPVDLWSGGDRTAPPLGEEVRKR